MHLELQRTDRVRHPFEEVTLPVGKVIHGVDAPLRTRAVVRHLDDAVDDGVAEVHVRRSHIDLRTQDHRTFGELPSVHAAEEIEALLDGAVAIGAGDTRDRRRTLLRCDLLGRLLIDVSMACADQLFGELVQTLEVVRSIVDIAPVEAEPLDILTDSIDVLDVFLRGIRIVEAEVTHPTIVLCDTEVHADGLGVPDVEIAVGLWWETRLDASIILPGTKVALDDLLDEVQALLLFPTLCWGYAVRHI